VLAEKKFNWKLCAVINLQYVKFG